MRITSRSTSWMVLLFALALVSWGINNHPQVLVGGTRASYFPEIMMQTQDKKDVRFYEDLIKDKIVVINLMYTRCDGKLCNQGTRNLVQIQKGLGDHLGREVFMYSITLDPEHDTPEVLNEYAKEYGARWTFLTGKAEDITALRRKLGMFDPDPKVDADRTKHSGMIKIGNDSFNRWSSTSVLAKPERILEMIQRTKPPTADSPSQKEDSVKAPAVTINGVRLPNRWDPPSATVKAGDVVEWHAKDGKHGVIFTDWDMAKLVLDVDTTASLEIKPQPDFPAPAQGTVAKNAPPDTLLLRATVKAIPAGMTELLFICTQHGDDMKGKLVLQPGDAESLVAGLSPNVQRRMLRFMNRAYSAADLTKAPQEIRVKSEHGPMTPMRAAGMKSSGAKGFPEAMAKKIFPLRPLEGWKDVRDCLRLYGDANSGEVSSMRRVLESVGPSQFGEWKEVTTVAVNGGEPEPIMNAALLHTGKVLLIPNNTNTVLWDPNAAANSIQIIPGNTTGLTANLFCSGHSFLTDGRLLAVGGGGGGPGQGSSIQGWKFDPTTTKWTRTRTDMAFKRWYPTLVTLGSEPGRVLVASGWMEVGDDPAPRMEIYSEATDSFQLVTASGPVGDLTFRPTYPGLHMLPGGEILHVPTGFERCDQSPSGAIADPTAIFGFSTSLSGSWRTFGVNHRVKGMSVLLFNQTTPFVQAMVVGGGDLGTSRTAQTMDLSSLSPRWDLAFPLLESRVHPNAVILPDGTVFICGGMEASSQPPPNGGRCELYDPKKNLILEMDELRRPRHYHSMAILLPTGQVMAAGGAQPGGCSVSVENTIEVFSPPYLFRGARPAITSVPKEVEHGETFSIETPTAGQIARVMLARPMSITHQTDSGQRVIPLTFRVTGSTTIEAQAPGGSPPNSFAPRGHYMLFILNDKGVPAVAKWIFLR